MTNSRGTGKLVRLYKEITSGDSATETFTPTTAIVLTKYSKLIITLNGAVSAAAGLLLKFNSLTDYDEDFTKNDSTVITGTQNVAAAYIKLLGSELLDGANKSFFGTVEIYMNTVTSKIQSVSLMGAGLEGHQINTAEIGATATTITNINFTTSTGNFVDGTEFTIYGLLR